VKEYSRANHVRLLYLPAYSPELAAIETFFARFKSSLIKSAGYNSIDLGSGQGLEIVAKAIHTIERPYLISLWRSFLRRVDDLIGDSSFF